MVDERLVELDADAARPDDQCRFAQPGPAARPPDGGVAHASCDGHCHQRECRLQRRGCSERGHDPGQSHREQRRRRTPQRWSGPRPGPTGEGMAVAAAGDEAQRHQRAVYQGHPTRVGNQGGGGDGDDVERCSDAPQQAGVRAGRPSMATMSGRRAAWCSVRDSVTPSSRTAIDLDHPTWTSVGVPLRFGSP